MRFIEGFSLARSPFSLEEMTTLLLSMQSIRKAGSRFESHSRSILAKAVTPGLCTPYHIRTPEFQKLDTQSSLIQKLEQAIHHRTPLLLVHHTSRCTLEPYKILNLDGIWYLLGRDRLQERMRLILIHKIQFAQPVRGEFQIPEELSSMLDREIVSAYFDDQNRFAIEVLVRSNIAELFKLRPEHPSQELLLEHPSGELHLRFWVTHLEDVDNIIKEWLPDIRVLSPQSYREQIERELQSYLTNDFFHTLEHP